METNFAFAEGSNEEDLYEIVETYASCSIIFPALYYDEKRLHAYAQQVVKFLFRRGPYWRPEDDVKRTKKVQTILATLHTRTSVESYTSNKELQDRLYNFISDLQACVNRRSAHRQAAGYRQSAELLVAPAAAIPHLML